LLSGVDAPILGDITQLFSCGITQINFLIVQSHAFSYGCHRQLKQIPLNRILRALILIKRLYLLLGVLTGLKNAFNGKWEYLDGVNDNWCLKVWLSMTQKNLNHAYNFPY
jgi:hypothetical protein